MMTAANMSMMVVALVIATMCIFTAKGEEEKVSSSQSRKFLDLWFLFNNIEHNFFRD